MYTCTMLNMLDLILASGESETRKRGLASNNKTGLIIGLEAFWLLRAKLFHLSHVEQRDAVLFFACTCPSSPSLTVTHLHEEPCFTSPLGDKEVFFISPVGGTR